MDKLIIKQFEPDVFGIYKPAGLTPLQALGLLKNSRPELDGTALTYAGRLDPMAEGLLLVLAGSKVHEKDKYLKLDKTYTVTALLEFETDSFDLLGVPALRINSSVPIYGPIIQPINRHATKIQDILQSYVGTITLALPPYSSPPHKGKPLFWWTRLAGLSPRSARWAKQQGFDPGIPLTRQTTLYAITDLTINSLAPETLLAYIQNTIPLVDGDFRQNEIINAWHELLFESNAEMLQTASFTIECSSGTYVRSLVQDLGQKLGTGACVYKLVRNTVGSYTLD